VEKDEEQEVIGEGTATGAYLDSLIGRRVRLVRCTDTFTDLRPGDLGTVSDVDATGTVFVRWEGGSNLGLVHDAGDRFEVVTGTAAEHQAWLHQEEG
jgi:Domain of unknown function (DUF4314)